MKDFKQFKRELLKNKKIKEAYEKLEPEFALIKLIIKKRIERGLTQKELAYRIGTRQSAISRFESGLSNPTLSFLQKLAGALGSELKISV